MVEVESRLLSCLVVDRQPHGPLADDAAAIPGAGEISGCAGQPFDSAVVLILLEVHACLRDKALQAGADPVSLGLHSLHVGRDHGSVAVQVDDEPGKKIPLRIRDSECVRVEMEGAAELEGQCGPLCRPVLRRLFTGEAHHADGNKACRRVEPPSNGAAIRGNDEMQVLSG